MADITNNPFIDKTASAASRYPSLDTDRSSSPHVSAQYTSWLQSPVSSSSGPYISNGAPSPMANNPVGYSGVQPVYQQPQTPYAQQWSAPQPAYGMQPSQYSDQGTQGLAPSGSYGQQFVAQSTGYPQHQNYAGMPQQGYGGYQSQFGHGQQQQQQTSAYGGNSYLAQFDPYSNNITSPTGQAPPLSTNPSFSSGSVNSHSPHPRTFISTHKAELEQWDAPIPIWTDPTAEGALFECIYAPIRMSTALGSTLLAQTVSSPSHYHHGGYQVPASKYISSTQTKNIARPHLASLAIATA